MEKMLRQRIRELSGSEAMRAPPKTALDRLSERYEVPEPKLDNLPTKGSMIVYKMKHCGHCHRFAEELEQAIDKGAVNVPLQLVELTAPTTIPQTSHRVVGAPTIAHMSPTGKLTLMDRSRESVDTFLSRV